ncbi:MAG: HEAT repeat domain-containing protein [Verrucomicrobiales bacterium]|nr:HEAT repeat domain-containing protein [Verrucomicrobiales bacterium]
MRRLPQLLLMLFVVATLTALTVAIRTRNRLTHEGRTLEQWTAEAERANRLRFSSTTAVEDLERARKAIRAIGTNGVPELLSLLNAPRDLGISDRVANFLATNLPSFGIAIRNPSQRWIQGIRGFEALGEAAAPWIPELVAATTNNIGYGSPALVAVGVPALPAMTNLLSSSAFPLTGNLIGAFANAIYSGRIPESAATLALPSLLAVADSKDSHARSYALTALGAIHQQPADCIPTLLKAVSDPSPQIQENAIRALGAFGPIAGEQVSVVAARFNGAPWTTRHAICSALARWPDGSAVSVPILLQGLRDPELTIRISAATALGEIRANPEQVLPALMKTTAETNESLRIMTLQSIGHFGTNALPAKALLEAHLQDPNPSVRDTAATALKRVRGEIPPP